MIFFFFLELIPSILVVHKQQIIAVILWVSQYHRKLESIFIPPSKSINTYTENIVRCPCFVLITYFYTKIREMNLQTYTCYLSFFAFPPLTHPKCHKMNLGTFFCLLKPIRMFVLAYILATKSRRTQTINLRSRQVRRLRYTSSDVGGSVQ